MVASEMDDDGSSSEIVVPERTEASEQEPSFRVVGIGASAGGLAAMEAFFQAMPADSGMAFILVTHLAADRASLLPELLQKSTSMRVQEIANGEPIQPNHIYTNPPGFDVGISHGVFQLLEPREVHGLNLPINNFFDSLSLAFAEKAVAIVLSGTGSDGTEGIRLVHCRLGMVMVQSCESAKYDGMPRSAIATGLTDYVLPAEEMPAKLTTFASHASTVGPIRHADADVDVTGALEQIFLLLRTQTGHDFSGYKRNTILRRIERRMNVHQFDRIGDYVNYLRESEHEATDLFHEMLISVTSFFRDEEAFASLQSDALPKYLAFKSNDLPFRAWVTGCATGEEAYSIAILLHECMEALELHLQVQVFATDIDPVAIDAARLGRFAPSIATNVSPSRLRRYFYETEDGQLQVKKMIREMVVFAPQNVAKDPPFTKMDLICCRNLLIYFQPELQQRLIPIFHYSLVPHGLLMLGTSETIGLHADLFEAVDKKWKLYTKKAVDSPMQRAIGAHSTLPANALMDGMSGNAKRDEAGPLQLVETILQHSTALPCVVIDDKFDVVYVHGRTGKFLELAEGKASMSVLDMARPGLKTCLATAIRQVSTHGRTVTQDNIEVHAYDQKTRFNLLLTPVTQYRNLRGMIVITFEEVSPSDEGKARIEKQPQLSGKTVEELELELQATRDNLQTMVEELQAVNEELKSTNEELQSTNEELQSTNEELETSKEELQSLNEESATVNSELQARIDTLSKTTDDMKNLLDSTDIATIFLDIDLKIRGYTPRAVDLIPLAASDKGRPISDLATNLDNKIDLRGFSAKVLDDLVVREQEVLGLNQNIYLLKARPYRTLNNMIDGVVLTFENVTQLKAAANFLSDASTVTSDSRLLTVLRASTDGVVLANENGNIKGVNQVFCDFLGYTESELLKMSVDSVASCAHADSLQLTKTNWSEVSDFTDEPKAATFEMKFVKKNSEVATGHVTVTWHVDAATNAKVSIAFVRT